MHHPTNVGLLRLIRITGLFLLLAPSANSQISKPSAVVIDGRSFVVVEMTDGLPGFPPIKRRLVSEFRYATITPADSLGTIYICKGRDAQGRSLIVVLHHRYDQTWMLTPLASIEDTTELIRTTFDLTPLTGKETPFPLDIRINLSQHMLFYRWLLSPEVPSIPGGLPTPANALLDVGKPLFDFFVTDFSGKNIHSSELRGKVTVVDWWATWCTACVAEIPGYNDLVQKYQSRVDFVAIAMNTPDEVRTFLMKHPFRFRQTVATDSMFRLIGSGIPRTILMNEQRLVVFDHAGGSVDSYKDLEKAIQAILVKKRD